MFAPPPAARRGRPGLWFLRGALLVVVAAAWMSLAPFRSCTAQDAAAQQDAAAESSEAALAAYADAANFQTNGALDLAIEAWQKFLKEHGDDPLASKAAHYLGVCYMQRGEPQFEAAADAFARALQDPKFELREESLANRGWCLYAAATQEEPKDQQQLREAIRTFEQLIKEHPRSDYLDRARFYSGEAAYALGDAKRAIAYYDAMLKSPDAEKSPLRCDALYARGVAQEGLKLHDAAVESYRTLLQQCADSKLVDDVRLRLADVLVLQGKYQQAIEGFQQIAAKNGDDAPYATFRQAFALVQLGKPAEAAAKYEEVIEQFPDSSYAAAALLASAQSHYRAGQMEQASERFRQVLQHEDQAAATEAAHWLAQIAMASGQAAEAEGIAAAQIQRGAEGPYRVALHLDRAEAVSLISGRAAEALKLFTDIYRDAPDDPLAPRALYSAAFAALQSGDRQQAVDLAREFLGRFADDTLAPDVRYIAAEAKLMAGNHADAAKAYAELLKTAADNPQRSLWVLRAATAMYLAGQYDQAIATLTKEVDQLTDPAQRSEAHFLIGASHLFASRPAEAIPAFQASRSSNQQWARADEALLLMGQAQLQADDSQAAARSWQQVISDYPQSRMADQARYKLAQLASQAGDHARAIELYTQILGSQRDPGLHPYALYGKGWSLMQREQYQQAVEPLTALYEQYPQHVLRDDAQLARGTALRKSGNLDAAHTDLTAFLQSEPQGIALGHALYELALIEQQREQPAKAAEHLRRLVREVPDYEAMEDVLYELAWSLKESGQPDQAADSFEQLVARYPQNPLAAEAHYFLGQQHYQAKQWQAAADAFRQAAELTDDPALAEKAAYRRGWSRFQAGEYDAAAELFQQQAEQYPEGTLTLDALLMTGECRFKQEQYDAALAAYTTARDRILAADENQDRVKDAEQRRVRELVLLHGGQSAGQLGRWTEALQWYETLRQRFPATDYLPQVFYETGFAHQQLGNDEQALKFYQEVADNYRNEIGARARFMSGEVYFAGRELSLAIPEFQRVMYGYGAEQAPEAIKNWQAKSGFEAGRCAELLIQSAEGNGKQKAMQIAKDFYQYVVEKHPRHELASKAKERLELLKRL